MLFLLLVLLFGAIFTSSRNSNAKVRHLQTDATATGADHTISNSSRYRCTRDARISGSCRWCNRDIPPDAGVFSTFPPFWQHPGPCQNQAFDVRDTRKCMTGRTLYVIGNSVARQSAFNMVEMLGGNPVKREDQRDQCPKHETTWDDSCHSEIAGVKIKYLFLQYPDGVFYDDRNGFPYFRYKTSVQSDTRMKEVWTTGKIAYNETKPDGTVVTKYYTHPKQIHADHDEDLWEEDNCVKHDMRSCLARFFANSTDNDLLIFTLGMTFAITGAEPSSSPGIDNEKWLRNSAAAFKGHLAATFKGQVFRVTLAEYNMRGYLQRNSHRLARVNSVLWEEWMPDSSDMPWYTIDQWSINKDRYEFYNDHVHFNGVLTHAMLTQVLNELCPGGGKTTWTYPKDGNMSTIFNTYPTVILQVPLSGRSNWYMVLHNGQRHNIPNMDTFEGLDIPPGSDKMLLTSNAEIAQIPEGAPLVPCDKAWVPNTCVDSVYYKALHSKT